MVLCTTLFTLMATISKMIGARACTEEKLFWRSATCALCTVLTHLGSCGGKLSPHRPRRPGLLLLRGLCGHIAFLGYIESIERLPLAVAVFLGKTSPLSAAICGWLFLGEPLRGSRIVAIFVSLCGVALIARPAPGDVLHSTLPGVMLGVGAGVVTGMAYCCVRALTKADESPFWVLLALPTVSLLCSAPVGLRAALHVKDRGADVWLMFIAMGVIDQGAQVFLRKGLLRLSIASGTQTMYFGTIVAVLLGTALGDAWPSWQFWLGGAIIVGALHGAEVAERRAIAAAGAGDLPEELLKPRAGEAPCGGCAQELARASAKGAQAEEA